MEVEGWRRSSVGRALACKVCDRWFDPRLGLGHQLHPSHSGTGTTTKSYTIKVSGLEGCPPKKLQNKNDQENMCILNEWELGNESEQKWMFLKINQMVES